MGPDLPESPIHICAGTMSVLIHLEKAQSRKLGKVSSQLASQHTNS